MNSMPEQSVQLRICSTPVHLSLVRAAAERFCQAIGFDDDTGGAIVLAVDEALANIIKHAYHGADDQPIEIELTPLSADDGGGLKISVRDYGQWVDPAEIKSRDLADVRPGGLGVHIMNECMDCVEFAPADGGGTRLTMVKQLPVGQEAT